MCRKTARPLSGEAATIDEPYSLADARRNMRSREYRLRFGHFFAVVTCAVVLAVVLWLRAGFWIAAAGAAMWALGAMASRAGAGLDELEVEARRRGPSTVVED